LTHTYVKASYAAENLASGRNWVRTSDPSLVRCNFAVARRRLPSPEEASSCTNCRWVSGLRIRCPDLRSDVRRSISGETRTVAMTHLGNPLSAARRALVSVIFTRSLTYGPGQPHRRSVLHETDDRNRQASWRPGTIP
jgi:hypothetical protein